MTAEQLIRILADVDPSAEVVVAPSVDNEEAGVAVSPVREICVGYFPSGDRKGKSWVSMLGGPVCDYQMKRSLNEKNTNTVQT